MTPSKPILAPMLASIGDAPLADPRMAYEPKYDGIRAIVEVHAEAPARIWSRLGNEKTKQFPEIASALEQWARKTRATAILDGEIVALDAEGRPAGFQRLQGRIHIGGFKPHRASRPKADAPLGPTAFIAFDLLRHDANDLRGRPLTERRAALEQLFTTATRVPGLRLSEIAYGDGRALFARAQEQGWEGLIAKRSDSRYKSGKRTPDWRKMKILHEQEFVVGGWTNPRSSRTGFGALLLGVYEDDALVYAGHVGTGFDERELSRLLALLRPLEVKTSPFAKVPPSNEQPHWAKPTLVAQVRFTEWTDDGVLRHPVYLGLRDDKTAAAVKKEAPAEAPAAMPTRGHATPRGGISVGSRRGWAPEQLIQQLRALEDSRKDGVIVLPGGGELAVTNLHKLFWPKLELTKGDLFRYYATVASFILPAVKDRALVMKRFPNGIDAKPFYQHRATYPPAGVRVELVEHSDENRPQFIGGDLITLLYMTQLAAISQDPWFSRVQSAEIVDYVAIDLDPMPGVPFTQILDVARWVRDELDTLGAFGVPKTSGAEGLHIYIPMPKHTPYETGLLFCQIVATIVAHKHPKVATVERAVKSRGRTVYVDYLQNIVGKTLATAYSARASDYAGVSTPLSWREVDAGVERESFTIETVPARLAEVGDLWEPLRRSKGIDLERATRSIPNP